MPKEIDITGERYGRLVAVKKSPNRNKSGGTRWIFQCDCGNTKEIGLSQVRSGLTKSCGCMAKPHGDTGKRLHNIWVDMRMRCIHNGVYWGAKGITVCEEWNDYQAFREWAMSHGYNDSMTLDRIDSAKDYCPDNCRWASYKTQANNQTSNRLVTINGITKTLSEWVDTLGIVTKSTVYRRVRKGWSFEKALTTPNVRKQGTWRI